MVHGALCFSQNNGINISWNIMFSHHHTTYHSMILLLKMVVLLYYHQWSTIYLIVVGVLTKICCLNIYMIYVIMYVYRKIVIYFTQNCIALRVRKKYWIIFV